MSLANLQYNDDDDDFLSVETSEWSVRVSDNR